MHFSFLLQVVSLCGVLLLVAPVKAAPAAKSDKTVRREFVARYDQELQGDSKAALALFRQFVQEHSDLEATQMIAAYEDVASHLFKRDRAQLETALALLEEGKARYATEPARFDLVSAQAYILRESERSPDSEALLRAAWPQALGKGVANSRRQALLWEYTAALRAQNKEAQAETLIWEALAQQPLLLKEPDFAWMTMRVLGELKKQDQVLSWAKLNFALAPFDQKGLASATKLMSRAWVGGEFNMSVPRAFAAAQTDPNAPNPLDEIAAVAWPAPVQNALLQAAQEGRADGRITALLALEKHREAMLVARDDLIRHPTSADSLEQVARVFKAADGDVVRANAFISYYSDGKGENPMTAFLDETAATPTGK